MSARLRSVTNVAAGGVLLGALMLGGLWLRDRTHRWESPRWSGGDFVHLRSGAPADRAASDTWVIAVNPRCAHCMNALSRVHAVWTRNRWPEALVVLIVDTPRRPDENLVRALPAGQVWWDRAGIWRRRWGHRIYGEIIQFDGGGRFIRTVTAHDILRRRQLPRPGEPLAPADRKEGGI
jgi:hypothetical protein